MNTKKQILIVEDEIIVAEDLARTLEKLDYEICGKVTSGPQALKECAVLKPDMVLMDIVLKGDMSGITAADKIRNDYQIPVVYVTAYADEKTLEKAKLTGPFGYILKPFTERDLRSTIEMAVYRNDMEKKLREREIRFSTTLRSIGDGVIVVDISAKITFMNTMAENLTGWTFEAAKDQPLKDVFRLESDGQPMSMDLLIADVLRFHKVLHLPDVTLLHKVDDRPIPIDDCLAPMIPEGGKVSGLVLVFKDITERRLAQAEKEKIHAQLLQAQKMEAIGLLAGGIAHDFNNLLTVIQGNANLAMLKVNKENALYRDLTEIEAAAERAADLTSQLLLFSRKQPMRFGPLHLNDVVRAMTKMLKLLIGEDIRLITHLAAELDVIFADRGTIEQVIMNIVVNARDAMPEGGTVTIETRPVYLDASVVETMPEARAGHFARMTISDTGQGIDPKHFEHLFEPFFSTKAPGKGTGLGLSVVYGIVKQHDGWIYVTSEMGKGATFQVFIPVLETSVTTSGKEQIRLYTVDGQGRRILVVEDEEGVRTFLRAALLGVGFHVSMAGSVDEAKRIFSESEGRFDLVFSDVVLPDGNGVELVDSFKQKHPDLRCILSSGYTGAKSMWTAIQVKRYPFIHKPFNRNDLMVAIQSVLDIRTDNDKNDKPTKK